MLNRLPAVGPPVAVADISRPIAGWRATLNVSVYGAADWPRVAAQWTELAERSPYSSFYLSSDWITAWLQVFSELLKPQILIFEEGNETVGACLLTRSVERRGPFRLNRMYLNTGGESIGDRTLMEFNSILCCPGKEEEVAQALGSYSRLLLWDEFAIEGMCPNAVLRALQTKAFPGYAVSLDLRPTFYVDMNTLRRSGICYLDSLSANTRGQIRRSLSRCRRFGEIKVEIAPDLRIAEEFFEEMCGMHQARWTTRGQAGAFCPGRRLEFHRALIRRAHSNGSVQLLRVRAGGETLGILYNFVQKGKIYFFQSGFNYGLDRRLKPGFVTHACAIQHYLDIGMVEYDFLAGEARYKASLAKGSGSLMWIVFARPSIKLSSIELLRILKRCVKFNK